MTRDTILLAAAEAAYGARVAIDHVHRLTPTRWDGIAPVERQRWIGWVESLLTGDQQPDPEDATETGLAEVARAVARALGFDVQTVAGPSRILWATGQRFHVTPEQLRGGARHSHLALARHVAMYLCKRAGYSYPVVGRLLGNRDHTTVMSGVRKVERLVEIDPKVREHVVALATGLGLTLPDQPAETLPEPVRLVPAPPISAPTLTHPSVYFEIPPLFEGVA